MIRHCSVLLCLLIGINNAPSAQDVTPHTTQFLDFDETLVSGTTGTPLGGFGAGGIKFNANDGTFAVMTVPPADAYDFLTVEGARIEMTVNGKTTKALKAAKTAEGRTDDDALWPVHRVNFGSVEGIVTKMTAVSPFDNGNYENMSLPYALYEVTMTNITNEKSNHNDNCID